MEKISKKNPCKTLWKTLQSSRFQNLISLFKNIKKRKIPGYHHIAFNIALGIYSSLLLWKETTCTKGKKNSWSWIIEAQEKYTPEK